MKKIKYHCFINFLVIVVILFPLFCNQKNKESEEKKTPPKQIIENESKIDKKANKKLLTQQFDKNQLWQYLQKILSFGPRCSQYCEGHKKVIEYFNQQMETTADKTIVQDFSQDIFLPDPETGDRRYFTVEMANVIGRFRLDLKQRLLVGGHFDTRAFADEGPPDKHGSDPVIGANDGGSGPAVLLALADRLQKTSQFLTWGIDIVFTDGEEVGTTDRMQDYFLGSKHYVSVMDKQNLRPTEVIILDMIGGGEIVAIPKNEYEPLLAKHRSKKDILAKLANGNRQTMFFKIQELNEHQTELGESCYKDLMEYKKGFTVPIDRNSYYHAKDLVLEVFGLAKKLQLPGFIPEVLIQITDDHIAFHEYGIPAMLLIDFDHPRHSYADTLDICSKDSLWQTATLVWNYIYENKMQKSDST
jgi:hypothetical protein